MGPGLDIGLALGTGTLLTNVLGGVPIVFDGVHVGGLGVAGGTPAQDADIARHVLAMIGADPAAELS
jgi:glc operon protein GlcG